MHKLLKQWDASLSADQHARLDACLSRRRFLLHSLKATGALGLSANWLALSACSDRHSHNQAHLSQTEPWHTFAATQRQLFPNDGNGPGADTVNATSYLQFVLAAPDTDPEERQFILNGIDWLNRLAIARYTGVFAGCAPDEQHTLLHQISHSQAGERWLSYLLTYIFEALLSDPIYGGNPHGIGWKWLDYIPGFPRPPANKRYIDLL